MPESLLFYVGVPAGFVILIAGTVYGIRRYNHNKLVSHIDQELNEAAGVDRGTHKEMVPPSEEEKREAEREMWEDETS